MTISEIEYYVPNEELAIDQFVASLHNSTIPIGLNSKDEYITYLKQSIGFKSIRVETHLEAHEMMDLVIQNAIDKGKISPKEVDMLVFIPGGYQPKYPNMGQYLKYRHKIDKASILNIGGNDCVNIEMSVKVCTDLMKVNRDLNNILIVTASKVEETDQRVIGKFSIGGDAAGLLVIRRDLFKIQLHDLVDIYNPNLFRADPQSGHILEHYIHVVRCLSKLIKRNNLKTEQISKVIIQNGNSELLRQCLNSQGVNENLIFSKNLARYGHLNQLDFLINLKDLTEEEKRNETQWIISIGMGWAGCYIATLMSF